MPQGLNHPGMSTAQQDNKPGAAFHHQGLVIEKPVFDKFSSFFQQKERRRSFGMRSAGNLSRGHDAITEIHRPSIQAKFSPQRLHLRPLPGRADILRHLVLAGDILFR